MSSRQQILFLMQKTQKEANWDMQNDSDFFDGNYYYKHSAMMMPEPKTLRRRRLGGSSTTITTNSRCSTLDTSQELLGGRPTNFSQQNP